MKHNNGEHLLIEFDPELAAKMGVPPVGTIWPSKVNSFVQIRLFNKAIRVVALQVAGGCIKAVNVVKDRRPKPHLSIDLDAIEPFDADKVLAGIAPELYAENPV